MPRTPRNNPHNRTLAGLPDRQAILDFIATQKTSVGKREIAKAFGLHAQDKIALKALLKEMGLGGAEGDGGGAAGGSGPSTLTISCQGEARVYVQSYAEKLQAEAAQEQDASPLPQSPAPATEVKGRAVGALPWMALVPGRARPPGAAKGAKVAGA
jgi:hypothetical protein